MIFFQIPTPPPILLHLAQERNLTELEFHQAATKKAETYPKENVKDLHLLPNKLTILSYQLRSTIYNFDYEKQYATFIPQQFNEHTPFEQTSKYDSKILPTEQVKFSSPSFF